MLNDEDDESQDKEDTDICISVVPFFVLAALERIDRQITNMTLTQINFKYQPLLYRGTDENTITISRKQLPLYDVLHALTPLECMGLAVLGEFFMSDWLVNLASTMLVRHVNSSKANKAKPYTLLLPLDVYNASKAELDDFFDDHLEKDHPWIFY